MTANEELIAWNTRWRLGGEVVSCKTCHARQREADRQLAFEHAPGCGYAGQLRRPWEDLEAICANFKKTR